ncbi:nuclear transport factor 2 family protein [Pseudoalteromonas ulvae]|nr:nuclear transport factor 2 family protein [Pseudoalteromonas ulvae]
MIRLSKYGVGLMLAGFLLNPSIDVSAQSNPLTEQALHTQAIVDLQLQAYNKQDIVAFAATYHDDVEIHRFPGGLQYQGKDELIKRYGKKFAELKCLHASSLVRMIEGRFLVDHELAQSCSKTAGEVDRSIKVIAAYEVEDGLIKRVTFMR